MMTGIFYLMGILKYIEIVKEIFIMEMQYGNVVIIPKELSQDHFPQSFRYYDPIIRIIQTNMCETIQK